MPFGRKKPNKQVLKIKTPPAITRSSFTNPLGDQFITETRGNKVSNRQVFTPFSQALIDSAKTGINSTLQEIQQAQSSPDVLRRQADDLFNLRAREINQEADALEGRARSNLSRRFGNSLSSTFGSNLLAQLGQNRLNQLDLARGEALDDAAQNLERQQRQRLGRLTTFQTVLSGLSGQSADYGQMGLGPILQERQRSSNLAVDRANLLARVQQGELAQENQLRQQRLGLLGNLAGLAFRLF
ncbi:MAG: hypothetical protein VKJ06_07850 [Vampirovibrionales bacterium]|nr:hypothetical protein [Vampirovibrionales bacterium]